MISIEWTNALDVDAARIEQKILRALKQNPNYPENYTKLYAERRYYHGTVGELAFEVLLAAQHIRHKAVRETKGRSVRVDYWVWREGRPYSLDVKTRSQPQHDLCMMPLAQFQAHQKELYVGERLHPDDHEIQILRYATRREVAEWERRTFGPHETITLCAPFESMHPIEDLLARLDRDDGR